MHLVVLVHGMWGRVVDFNYITEQLEHADFVVYDPSGTDKSRGASDVQLRSAKGAVYRTVGNQGYFTYDGIDICGTRVADEIEDCLTNLRRLDAKVDTLSVVGFSMGSLMIRYAIGLLDNRGTLDNLRLKAFITTCGPHVGVNVLGSALSARIFNFIGSYSMARTSLQAFLKDSDQPGGQPLFWQMTKPDSPWTKALSKFERRVLYANVVNDRRCEFYTASASTTDPFATHQIQAIGGSKLEGTFVSGYSPVVLDGSKPLKFSSASPPVAGTTTPYGFITQKLARLARLGWLAVRVGVVLPIWFCAFLLNAGFQYYSSKLRTLGNRAQALASEDRLETRASGMVEDVYRTVQADGSQLQSETLALTPVMQQIVKQFNACNWEKFYLYIPGTKMAHAAAIVKKDYPVYRDGKVGVKHLISVLTEEKPQRSHM